MNQKESDVIQSLLIGGVIGAALGVLLSRNKGAGVALGAIAGAAILASAKAYEKAQETEIPLVIEEDDAIYRVYSDGKRRLIKHLPKSHKTIPHKFILK